MSVCEVRIIFPSHTRRACAGAAKALLRLAEGGIAASNRCKRLVLSNGAATAAGSQPKRAARLPAGFYDRRLLRRPEASMVKGAAFSRVFSGAQPMVSNTISRSAYMSLLALTRIPPRICPTPF